MADSKRFDRWLRQAAEDPQLKELLARAEVQPDLPEQVLADYYAGALSPAEMERVEQRIAASERSSVYLAELDADVEGAIPPVARESLWARWAVAAEHAWARLWPAQPAWRLATSAA